MASQPRIISRREWGATRGIPSGRNVPLSSRRWHVVHWPVLSAASVRDERAACRLIDDLHRRQGWAVIGYNFLVGTNGIYEGAGLTVRGIHSPPRNVDGFGVCYLQSSDSRGGNRGPVTQQMRNNGRALYDWLCAQTGRRLTMSWHGQHQSTMCPGPDLIAWVRAGMPASGAPAPGPAPTPQPPRPEEVELIASATAQRADGRPGNFHVWVIGPQRRTIWLTHQDANSTSWWGGQPGRGPAGLRRFADAPQGRTFRGITATVSASGALHLFATLDDGRTMYTWQRRGEASWQPLQAFAPAP